MELYFSLCASNFKPYSQGRLAAHLDGNCVAPSCYLILEHIIGVHYDYLFLLNEIYCS